MKNLYSFSENPLNTESFVYMRKTPKSRPVEGPRTTETLKASTNIATTMTKLTLLVEHIDEKISFLANIKQKSKKGTERFKWARGRLILFKVLKKRMLALIKKLNKIEHIKEGQYTKVTLTTLNEINKEIDNACKIWGFNVRKSILKELKSKVFMEIVQKERANLFTLMQMFSLMKNNEIVRYKGMKIQKKGQKITVTYKKRKVEFNISTSGKKLKWIIRDNQGERIRKKPRKSSVLEGLFDSDELSIVPEGNCYYKPTSATKIYKNIIPVKKPKPAKKKLLTGEKKLVKKKEKIPKYIAGYETIIKDVKTKNSLDPQAIQNTWKIIQRLIKTRRTTIVYPKTKPYRATFTRSTNGRYLRITVAHKNKAKAKVKTQVYLAISRKKLHKFNKTAFTNKIEFPEDPLNEKSRIIAYKKPKKITTKPLDWEKPAKEAKEARERQAQLNKWGKEIAGNIRKLMKKLYNSQTIAFAFLKAASGKTTTEKMKVLNKYRYQLGLIAKKLEKGGPNIPKYINKLAKVYKLIPNKLKEQDSSTTETVMVNVTLPPVKVAILPNVLNKKAVAKKAPIKVAAKPVKETKSESGHEVRKFLSQTESKIHLPQYRKMVHQLLLDLQKEKNPKLQKLGKQGLKYIFLKEGRPFPTRQQYRVALKKMNIKLSPAKAVAVQETKEKVPGLQKWAKKSANLLNSFRKQSLDEEVLDKIFSKNADKVELRLRTIYRGLKNPKLTFTQAVKYRDGLRKSSRYIYTIATKKNIFGKFKPNVRTKLQKMTVLKFPPTPKTPTLAEKQLIKTEKVRVAKVARQHEGFDV